MSTQPALIASSDDVAWWDARFRDAPAKTLLAAVIRRHGVGCVALLSSFGAEAVVILKLISALEPGLPVLFLDTGKHFTATLEYVEALERSLGLRDLRVLRPAPGDLAAGDPHGLLHHADPDACCALRKLQPLRRALAGFDVCITGRKRAHGNERAGLRIADRDSAGRLRINPLCYWDAARVDAFITAHDLPRHPLAQHGYASIGCAPCTAPAVDGDPPRAGRWPGRGKRECGIHML